MEASLVSGWDESRMGLAARFSSRSRLLFLRPTNGRADGRAGGRKGGGKVPHSHANSPARNERGMTRTDRQREDGRKHGWANFYNELNLSYSSVELLAFASSAPSSVRRLVVVCRLTMVEFRASALNGAFLFNIFFSAAILFYPSVISLRISTRFHSSPSTKSAD